MDPNLHHFCRDIVDKLSKFYNDRLSVIYIIQVNWFYWFLYEYLLKPILHYLFNKKTIIVLNEAKDLSPFVNEESFPNGFFDENCTYLTEAEETALNEKCEADNAKPPEIDASDVTVSLENPNNAPVIEERETE